MATFKNSTHAPTASGIASATTSGIASATASGTDAIWVARCETSGWMCDVKVERRSPEICYTKIFRGFAAPVQLCMIPARRFTSGYQDGIRSGYHCGHYSRRYSGYQDRIRSGCRCGHYPRRYSRGRCECCCNKAIYDCNE